MNKKASIVMAATLAILCADPGFAKGGGVGMGSGGRPGGPGNHGQQAPDSAAQARAQPRLISKDQVQSRDRVQAKDRLKTRDQIRARDQDRIHQP